MFNSEKTTLSMTFKMSKQPSPSKLLKIMYTAIDYRPII